MTYQVQIPKGHSVWEKDSDHETFKSAKTRCIKLVGSSDYYSEPFTETKYIVPEKPFEWNGLAYENKETGEIKEGENITLFHLDEGYFGNYDKNSPWVCRIYIIN